MEILVRAASENDIPRLTEIYNYYVKNGYSNFGVHPKTVEQMMETFGKFSLTGPYRKLVAEEGDKIVGSASSFRYRESSVFDRTVETGISLDHRILGRGVGTLLYQSLFGILSKEKIHLAVVGIALPNVGSVALHEKFDFKKVGVFDEYAFLEGNYYSSLWMQKKLNNFV